MIKNPPADIEDVGLIPGFGRSPGGKNGNPLQYSCLGNPIDRGAWWAIVHGVTKESDTTQQPTTTNIKTKCTTAHSAHGAKEPKYQYNKSILRLASKMHYKYISELQKKKTFTKFSRGGPDANTDDKGYALCTLQMFLSMLICWEKRSRFPTTR